MNKNYNIKIKNLPDSEIEIEGEIIWEVIEKKYTLTLKKFVKEAELPGFRKGFAPEKLIIEKFGEMRILEEAAEEALNDIYPEIIAENKINYFGRPEIAITKIARGNPLSFKIKTAVVPKAELPDYVKIAKKIAGKKASITVDDKDVEEEIEKIRKNVAHAKHHEENPDDHNHDHKDEDLKLPEINDEFVKSLGDFKDVQDFKVKIREYIKFGKESREREKVRTEIIERIVEETKLILPKIIIESELDKMSAQFNDDITRMGLKPEDYLKHLNKTAEDFRKEWRPDAEKRAKANIVLAEISIKEKIVPEKEKVDAEVKQVLENYKDVDSFRVKMYVENMLTNEKVLEFLENQK